MDDVDTFSGIFIPADIGIYDIADPYCPPAALNRWLESLTLDEAIKTIRVLIEPKPIGLDAGIPG